MSHVNWPAVVFGALGIAALLLTAGLTVWAIREKVREARTGIDMALSDHTEVGGQRYRVSRYRHSLKPYSEADDEIGGRRDYYDGLGD